MSELITATQDTGLVNLLHGKGGDLAVPMPFERDIFLFDTYIAGTSYVEGIEDLEPFLMEGEKLNFFREPHNAYDSKAIVIKNDDGIKLGYVPKKDNAVFSRLMDAGKMLFGRISAKKYKGSWLKIDIKIYLRD
ncbi:MAG: HIRAN domain-containing protein [bacterium]|nr:HIRAN domain-containing protein [bacterium]